MAKIEQPHGGAINRFEKGHPGGPGRPKKVFSEILHDWKKLGYEKASAGVVMEVYQYLLSLPLTEILKIAGKFKVDESTEEQGPEEQVHKEQEQLAELISEENEYPIILRIAARDLLGKRGSEIVKDLLNRSHGTPTTYNEIKHHITGKIVNVVLPDNGRPRILPEEKKTIEIPAKD